MTTTARNTRRAAASIAAAVALTLTAGFAPVQTADAAQLTGTFRSRLTAEPKTATVLASADASLTKAVRTATRTTTSIRVASTPVTSTTRRTTAVASSTASTSNSAPAAAVDESAQARSILAGYISRYPILAGTTVSFGDAKGYQAICYYKSGRIVISPTHTASLDRILGHEIWHVIDWRDNGVIDWGENVPPR